MGKANALPSNRARLMATIDPDAYAAAAYTSDYVSMAEFPAIMAVVMAGTMQAGGTIDAEVLQATDAAGTGAKSITGKSITQLTQAGGDSDKQVIVNVRAEELDTANSFTHCALKVTVAVADCDMAGVVFGFDARYEPETDLASVDEIKT